MYDFLSGLRLTDTPYGVIEVEKGKEKNNRCLYERRTTKGFERGKRRWKLK